MTKRICVLLIVVGLVLSGCASVPKASESLKQKTMSIKPPKGKSIIYVIRFDTQRGAAILAKVMLDGAYFGTLAKGQFIAAVVEQGKHTARTTIVGYTGFMSILDIDTSSKEKFYIYIYPEWRGFSTNEISESEGIKLLKEYSLSSDNNLQETFTN